MIGALVKIRQNIRWTSQEEWSTNFQLLLGFRNFFSEKFHFCRYIISISIEFTGFFLSIIMLAS